MTISANIPNAPPPPYTEYSNSPIMTASVHSDFDPHLIDIDATTLIQGHGNIVSPDAGMIGVRIAAILLRTLQDEERADGRASRVRLKCGFRIVGTKNFVGAVKGVAGPCYAAAAAAGTAAAAAGPGVGAGGPRPTPTSEANNPTKGSGTKRARDDVSYLSICIGRVCRMLTRASSRKKMPYQARKESAE